MKRPERPTLTFRRRRDPRLLLIWGVLLACALTLMGSPVAPALAEAPARRAIFYPLIARGGAAGCAAIPGASYATLPIAGSPSDRPAHLHADLNLALRGYVQTTGALGLIDLAGPYDGGAPQLAGLFRPLRVPAFAGLFRVHDWNWDEGCRGDPICEPPVTLARMSAGAGEIVYVPDSGWPIGQGYAVLVLYVSPERITLKYTRDDDVVHGYTLHLEGLCVEPSLLELYEEWNEAGRSRLPALRGGQPLGRARADSIGVAIRDSGRFMDPRSRKDWWQVP